MQNEQPTTAVQQRVCICQAHTSSECLCGAWSGEQTSYWRDQELQAGFDSDGTEDDE